MRWLRPLVAAAALAAALCGCGRSEAPFASTARELRALPEDTEVLRARGLRDADVGVLSRFRSLGMLNLRAGAAAVPQRLTARGFREVAALPLPGLWGVTLGCSDGITNEAVRAIASIGKLRVVQLVRCGPFDVEGVRALQALKGLEELDLRGCPQLGDECVPVLSEMQSLKAPRSLRVTATGITGEGVRRLRSALGDLVVDDGMDYWRAEDPGAHGVAVEEE